MYTNFVHQRRVYAFRLGSSCTCVALTSRDKAESGQRGTIHIALCGLHAVSRICQQDSLRTVSPMKVQSDRGCSPGSGAALRLRYGPACTVCNFVLRAVERALLDKASTYRALAIALVCIFGRVGMLKRSRYLDHTNDTSFACHACERTCPTGNRSKATPICHFGSHQAPDTSPEGKQYHMQDATRIILSNSSFFAEENVSYFHFAGSSSISG